ncbi:MAG: hypothetical protein ACE5DO_01180 [Desulfobacterales bacterium]
MQRIYQLFPEIKKGSPGVWVNGAKIASAGLAVRRWVTYHGIALNVCIDPGWFDLIIPCGQPGEKITSMDREMEVPVEISEVKNVLHRTFAAGTGILHVRTHFSISSRFINIKKKEESNGPDR